MGANPPIFYLVVPCFNEQEVLSETSLQLKDKYEDLIQRGMISTFSRVLFVDDGSTDRTWEIICSLYDSATMFSGLKLSRNRGHQNALIAGLNYAMDNADVIGSMDADLQDDINALDEMLARYNEGYEVIYGVRKDRSSDTFFKRTSAQAFYRLQSRLGVESVYNHADYRLMSRRAVCSLMKYDEVNLFLRGMVPQIGFKSCSVYYSRAERFAGESKYPLKKMLAFAFEGITSFSTKPIRFITIAGMVIFIVSLLFLLYFLFGRLFGDVQAGWTSIVMSIWCLGGLQLLAIGVIGEYVGKTYMESKHRPRYIVEKIIDHRTDDDETTC
ncbi:glycosyltransferase family 2 protein [Collinsella phocaeensis]|uniref:glycosyltransferase family 2 protein n=1 Tax=Collinsella phocaeensis TaxID=1871016 RepID=UPI000930AF06|nr:glycosyltransferase family 2 protein [Collinsella phocaeensis]